MKKIIEIIAVVIVIGLIGFGIHAAKKPQGMEPQEPVAKTYSNSMYGYAVNLPDGFVAHAYTPDYVSIGAPVGEDGFDSTVDIAVVRGDVIKQIENMCAADGPHSNISCTGVARQSDFVSDTKLSGTRYYMKQEQKTLETGAVTVTEKGPFIAFDISANGGDGMPTWLVIHAPIAKDKADIDASSIEYVARTLQIK